MGSDDAKAEEWQESWAEDILDGLIQSLILVKDPYNQFSSSHDSKIPKALDFGWAAFWVQSAARARVVPGPSGLGSGCPRYQNSHLKTK